MIIRNVFNTGTRGRTIDFPWSSQKQKTLSMARSIWAVKNETIREQIEREIQRIYKERMWWAKLKWKMVKKRKNKRSKKVLFLRTRPTQRLEVKSRVKIAKREQEQLSIVLWKHRLYQLSRSQRQIMPTAKRRIAILLLLLTRSRPRLRVRVMQLQSTMRRKVIRQFGEQLTRGMGRIVLGL